VGRKHPPFSPKNTPVAGPDLGAPLPSRALRCGFRSLHGSLLATRGQNRGPRSLDIPRGMSKTAAPPTGTVAEGKNVPLDVQVRRRSPWCRSLDAEGLGAVHHPPDDALPREGRLRSHRRASRCSWPPRMPGMASLTPSRGGVPYTPGTKPCEGRVHPPGTRSSSGNFA
jgi:hypothetical protein